ncbi:MAG TPA: hypothetical protein VFA46_10910 [Actinomycetes bacterium]|nr:hypothetical protein [Actinomycetes bacterium]
MEKAAATAEEFLAEILTPEKEGTGHICWQCQHFKPVLKGSRFPPADLIGYCKAIHWPDYWCVSETQVVKSCYAFEQKAV